MSKTGNNKTITIIAKFVRSNTDPTQYKPYSPSVEYSNEYQIIGFPVTIPGNLVLSDKMVGKGKDRHREVILTEEGVIFLCKRQATVITQYITQGQ